MKRIRLTARFGNRMLFANSYESLEDKLLNEYKDLKDDAKRYRNGETHGFALHHLFDSDKNLIPSTEDKYSKGRTKRNKEKQSQYVRAVIEYSKKNTIQEKQDFIKEQALKGLILNDRTLKKDKKKLDAEIANSAYVPKEFHGHLHGLKNPPAISSRDELYDYYMDYLQAQSLNKLIKEAEKAKGSIYEEIKAIRKMVNYILPENGKQATLAMVDLSYNNLLNELNNKKEKK